MLTIRHLSDGSARVVGRRDPADVIDGPGLVWIDLDAPTQEEQQVVSSPVLQLHRGDVSTCGPACATLCAPRPPRHPRPC